jgi:hypothetical protein
MRAKEWVRAIGGFGAMAEYVTREEFEARVGVLDREVEGEKMVTRYILEQTQRNGDDLAILKTRKNRVEHKVDSLSGEVTGLRNEMAELRSEFVGLRGTVSGLVANLPRMIGDVVREVCANATKNNAGR